MTHIGNMLGYLAGYIDLGHWSGISWVGGGQFRKLSVISCIFMVICITVTCWTQVEEQQLGEVVGSGSQGASVQWRKAWRNVRDTIRDLPVPVRRVCYGERLGSRAYLCWDLIPDSPIPTSFSPILCLERLVSLLVLQVSHARMYIIAGYYTDAFGDPVRPGSLKSSTTRSHPADISHLPTLLPGLDLSHCSCTPSSHLLRALCYPGSRR